MAALMFHRLLGLALAAVIGTLPMVPPEHVHEVDDHGHIEFVVHRHATPHGVTLAHHDDATEVDHQDAPIATLDQDFVVPSPARVAMPASISVARPVVPPVATGTFRQIAYTGRLTHGPPRAPAGLRAPPTRLS